MADNKLAPDPVNTLTTTAGRYPSYQDLLKFLGANQPPVRFTPLEPGTKGEYDYNPRYGNTGEIRMNSNSLRYMRDAPAETARTLIHETTHATDRQLDTLYFKYKDRPPTPEIAQFVDGYKKLRWNAKDPNARFQSPPSEDSARRFDPKWAAENARYRGNASELYAHAVSNMAQGPDDTRYRSLDIPLHLDPPLATEHIILLNLANRAQKSLLAK